MKPPLVILSSVLSCIVEQGGAIPLDPRQTNNTMVAGPVKITSGTVQGKPSPLRPDVSAYLGIRYAQAPIGNLRFAAPVPVAAGDSIIDAKDYTPDCPSNRIPTDEAFIAGPQGQKLLDSIAQQGRPLGEDCLSVNVWTKPQSGEANKAVLFWIYGGGFGVGNSAAPTYDGSVLADENDVVVVSVNYRLGIFGTPLNPDALGNFGLMDMRLGLEWTRDNIAAFGGDPNRIAVFGQSAGGSAVDWLSMMYPNDPIAHGFIAHSGTAGPAVDAIDGSKLSRQPDWFRATNNAGCGGEFDGGAKTLACMRNKSMDEILGAAQPIALFSVQSGFSPLQDDLTVPINAVEQVKAGNISKVPFMAGNTDDELSFIPVLIIAFSNLTQAQFQLISPVYGLVHPILNLASTVAYTCEVSQALSGRQALGIPTYRYRYYGGDYENEKVDIIGSAYHTSELPMVFGTSSYVSGMPDSPSQASMGNYMRKAWAAFARDPVNGLSDMGWPQWDPNGATLAQLALVNATAPSFVPNTETDGLCPFINAYLNTVEDLENVFLGFTNAIQSFLDGIVDGLNNPAVQLMKDNQPPWTEDKVMGLLSAFAEFGTNSTNQKQGFISKTRHASGF